MRLRLRRPWDGDREAGSLGVVIAVVLVVSLLASSIAFRSIGSAFISSGRQSSASAVSQADAGLADALYRIDQGAAGTDGHTAFCVRSGDSNCVAGSVPAAPGVGYLATQVSSTDWLVRSEAVVNRQTAAVEGHITQQPAYPFALFGQSSLQLSAASPQFSTYSSSSPASATPGRANPNPSGAVTVGSNGTIACGGPFSGSVTVEYFGTGGVSSTGASPCGTYQSSRADYYLPSVSVPASAGACPGAGVGGGEFGSGIAGAPTALVGGTYLCTSPLSFSGYLNVTGPVQVYLQLDPDLYGPGTSAITIAPGSFINDQADYCASGGTSGCGSSPDLPYSQNLEIFTDDTGQVGNSSGTGFYLGALLYAPNAVLAGDACSSHYYGAVVVGAVSCSTGSPSFSYDASLAGVYGPWTAGSYSQINPSDFDAAMAAAHL